MNEKFFQMNTRTINGVRRTIRIHRLFLFRRPICVNRRQPRINATRTPRLRPKSRLVRLIRANRPLRTLRLNVTLSRVSLCPLNRKATLPRGTTNTLRGTLGSVTLGATKNISNSRGFPSTLIIPVFRQLSRKGITMNTRAMDMVSRIGFILKGLRRLILYPRPTGGINVITFLGNRELWPVRRYTNALTIATTRNLRVDLNLTNRLLPLSTRNFLLPLLRLLRHFIPNINFTRFNLINSVLVLPNKRRLSIKKQAETKP